MENYKEVANKKLLLLQKPIWTLKDVIEYTGFKTNKALELKSNAIIMFNGHTKEDSKRKTKCKSEAILKMLGTNRKSEIECLLLQVGGKENV